MVILLIIAQFTFFVKQIFEGTIWSMIYGLMLTVGTSIIQYFLIKKPLISPEKFPDESWPEDNQRFWEEVKVAWLNFYKHPLTVDSKRFNFDDGTISKLLLTQFKT